MLVPFQSLLLHTLQTNLTAVGYKASKEDLTEMLVEISKSEHPPDIEFPLKVINLMQQNVSLSSTLYFREVLALSPKCLSLA